MTTLAFLCKARDLIDNAIEPLFSNRTTQSGCYVYIKGSTTHDIEKIIKEYVEGCGLQLDEYSIDKEKYSGYGHEYYKIKGIGLTITNPNKENCISLEDAEKLLGKTIIVGEE